MAMTSRTISIRAEIFNRRRSILSWVDGRPILIARVDDSLWAMNAVCSHMGCALLSDVEGPVATCPAHEAKWDIRTGALIAPPKVKPEAGCEYSESRVPLETYRVKEHDGLLEVDIDS